jgi:hypothetical protein
VEIQPLGWPGGASRVCMLALALPAQLAAAGIRCHPRHLGPPAARTLSFLVPAAVQVLELLLQQLPRGETSGYRAHTGAGTRRSAAASATPQLKHCVQAAPASTPPAARGR